MKNKNVKYAWVIKVINENKYVLSHPSPEYTDDLTEAMFFDNPVSAKNQAGDDEEVLKVEIVLRIVK